MSPLTADLGAADLVVLERYADPNTLVKLGVKRLTTLITRTSKHQQGVDRAREWIAAAEASIELYADHPAVAYTDLAAEIATEVRLLRAVQSELVAHATEREHAYQRVDPTGLARSLPGVATIGGPALVAAIGDPARFARGKQFRSFTGLVPKASETGDTDRKGQPMSKPARRCYAPHSCVPLTPPAKSILNSPASTTCRWSNAAKTTSARCASWPRVSPNDSGRS